MATTEKKTTLPTEEIVVVDEPAEEPAPTGTLVIGGNYTTKDDVKAIAEEIPLSNFELPEGSVDMNSQKIINLADPENDDDAVNRKTLMYQVYDLSNAIGDLNLQGNVVSGTNDDSESLNINKGTGQIFVHDEDQEGNVVQTRTVQLSSLTTADANSFFKYVRSDETVNEADQVSQADPKIYGFDQNDPTNVPDKYDAEGNLVPQYTIQVFYVNKENQIVVTPGYVTFESIIEARVNFFTNGAGSYDNLKDYVKIAALVISTTCTKLSTDSKSDDYEFIQLSRAGVPQDSKGTYFDIDQFVHVNGQSKMLKDLNLNNNKITMLKDPENPQDAANKDYVDQMKNKLWNVFQAIGSRNLMGNELVADANSLTKQDGKILFHSVSDDGSTQSDIVTTPVLDISKQVIFLTKDSSHDYENNLSTWEAKFDDLDKTAYAEQINGNTEGWYILRVWYSHEEEKLMIQAAQNMYKSQAEAAWSHEFESFQKNEDANNNVFLGYVFLSTQCQRLSDKNTAFFKYTNIFGQDVR